jgi:hypothetical protein
MKCVRKLERKAENVYDEAGEDMPLQKVVDDFMHK